jgi:hypothetical protein
MLGPLPGITSDVVPHHSHADWPCPYALPLSALTLSTAAALYCIAAPRSVALQKLLNGQLIVGRRCEWTGFELVALDLLQPLQAKDQVADD